MTPFDTHKKLHRYITSAHADPPEMDRIIQPSKTLSPSARAEIYRKMYELRMTEAIRDDFPIVEQFLGTSDLDSVSMQYVQHYPSNTHSLNHLGKNFAKFLQTYEPTKEKYPFLVELAQIEWAMVEVFHSKIAQRIEIRALDESLIASWMEKTLCTSPSLRSYKLTYNINKVLDQYFNETPVVSPPHEPQYLAIYRTEAGTFRMELPRTLFELLNLLDGKRTFGEAVDSILQDPEFVSQSEVFFERLHTLIADGCIYESS